MVAPDANSCCPGGEDCCQAIALTSLPCGRSATIRRVDADGPDAAYLRALGLRVSRRVRLCRSSGPWIVEVCCADGPACRIGLARELAARVWVEPAPAGA